MASRRKSHPTITLFSFQDVIMSVSGIIIVLVLLLSLELIQKPEHAAAATGSAVAGQLQAEIERAETARADMERRLRTNDERIQASTSLSVEDLRRQIKQYQAANGELAIENARLKSQVDDLQQRDRNARITAAERGDVRGKADAARQTADSLQQQVETERNENRPVFALPRGFNKQGWIAVISATDVTVAPLGRASRPRTFMAESGFLGRSADAAFLEWAQSLSSSSLYFLLMVRPDGIEAFDRICTALDERQTAYGFDLVPSGQGLLHAERGAYE